MFLWKKLVKTPCHFILEPFGNYEVAVLYYIHNSRFPLLLLASFDLNTFLPPYCRTIKFVNLGLLPHGFLSVNKITFCVILIPPPEVYKNSFLFLLLCSVRKNDLKWVVDFKSLFGAVVIARGYWIKFRSSNCSFLSLFFWFVSISRSAHRIYQCPPETTTCL